MPPPKNLIQQRLRQLLTAAAGTSGEAFTELAFRPRSEYEYRIADVAFLSSAEWARFQTQDYFAGAPQLVVEVLSPSNTAVELLDKEKLCLENGAPEFWIGDHENLQVKVSTPDGHTITYKSGQEIPLLFGGLLAVNSIFEL